MCLAGINILGASGGDGGGGGGGGGGFVWWEGWIRWGGVGR